MKDRDLVNNKNLQLSTYFFSFQIVTLTLPFSKLWNKVASLPKNKRLVEVKKYGGNAVSDNLIPLP